jgi:hypothetical protein
MADAAAHLDYIVGHLAGEPALARFASRMSVAGDGDEVVVTLAGRSVSIRASGQGLVLGSDDIDLAADPQETLDRVTKRLVHRLTQMDG